MGETDSQTVMCINSGSSSLKFHLYTMAGGAEKLLARGAVEGIGQGEARLWVVDGEAAPLAERALNGIDHEQAIDQALRALSDTSLATVDAIGHRVVHGGPNHRAPELVTPALMDDLQAHVAWAPLHMPAGLRVIEVLQRQRPGVPQVACFDTGFHATMPDVARRLPLPGSFYDQGIYKYGFHGLSYEYIVNALGDKAKGRLVIAHLGNGASMCACLDGRSVDTTMGMTPLGGFMMGTRYGDVDPGVLLYLMREGGYDDAGLEQLLDQSSGLKGVSGVTADMRSLLELCGRCDPAATQAVDMFCYQAAKTIGALAVVLGGLDKLVFTGGIGENAAAVRGLICERLRHLGVVIDQAKNEAGDECVSAVDAACTVMVLHTNEDLMIARHTHATVFGAQAAAAACATSCEDCSSSHT